MMKHLSTYKVFAMAFHIPDEALINALSEIPLFADSLQGVALEELKGEHTRLFSLSVAGGIPPYETEYGYKDIFLKTQVIADISGFYRAFGMGVSASNPDRMDFIAAELELMHWLTAKEEFAEEQGNAENVSICHDASKKFMNEHLGRWASFLGNQIAKSAELSFYRVLGEELSRFIDAECSRLELDPERIQFWEPSEPLEELTCSPQENFGATSEELPTVK